MEFYSSYLGVLLTHLTYPAEIIGCEVKFEVNNYLSMSIFGFSDTVLKLLSDISDELHALHSSKRSQTLFEVALDELIE
jgi:secreted Zn-dependent insulinase-like peptidase